MKKQERIIQLKNVDDKLFRLAKIAAIEHGTTLRGFCLDAIRRAVEPDKARKPA